ncbi:MAG: tRNA pseudouridine(13) synthase TruD [Planctomycetota bacterium]
MSEQEETSVDANRGPDRGPLCRAFATDTPGVGGVIKVRPEDFLVDEIPLYEPCGEGEHIYLGIEKTQVSHGELVGCLKRHFDVPEGAIGFAGMKDKQGVTRQVVSIHLHKDPASIEPDHDRIHVLWAERHRNKLRRGHLVGNRFSIRLRNVDAVRVPAVMQTISQLERRGVPTAFGEQRFGYRLNNHIVGLLLVRDQPEALVDEVLGSGGSWFPDHQLERRELFDAGEYGEAARLWTRADRTELILVKALIREGSARAAVRAVAPSISGFWLSALQSAVFNHVLEHRIHAGGMGRLVEGDLAWVHDKRAVFPVTAEERADPELAERLDRIEVSPSGPLWGAGMTRAAGAVGAVEHAALADCVGDVEAYLASKRTPDGGRRPLRAPLRHPEVDGGIDEHGHYIRVAFDLPRGVYATVAMGEVMKNDDERPRNQRSAGS